MSLSWPPKDPDENLDYKIDWTARLAGDTIQTSLWIVPVGLTKGAESNTNTATTVWLTGGTINTDPQVTNRITTAGGRTMDQTVKLKIRAK